MKFLFRWAFRLFLIFVVLVVAFVLLKDSLVKSVAENRIRSETGLDVKIGKLEAGLFSPTLTIEDLRIYNTAEFGGSPIIDVPELHLEAEARALASQRLHFKLVRIRFNEVNIVEGKDGRTNVLGVLSKLEELTSTNRHAGTGVGWEFAGIDTLNLTMGKFRYMSMKKPGKTTEVDLGLKNEIVTNVKSFDDLATVVVTAALQKGITLLGDPVPAPVASPPRVQKKLEITGKPHRKP